MPAGQGVAVLAALGAALGYASASVLQQRAARDQPDRHSVRLRLLANLARRPLWVAGFTTDLVAYALQFVALAAGSLIIVQPLLIASLLFALPLGAAFDHRRVGRRSWVAAAITVGGLCAFLTAAGPAAGRPDASARGWWLMGAGAAVVLGALTVIAARSSRHVRVACLAGAAGVTNAVAAALTKSCGHLLHRGFAHALAGWQPWALVAVAVASTVFTQSAFQAGPLQASLTLLTVIDPLVSVVLGAAFLDEQIRLTGLAPLWELLGVVAVAWGALALAGPAAGRHPAAVGTIRLDPRPESPLC